jgi:hypothetical protein
VSRGRRGGGELPRVRLDDNVGSYDVEQDGRGAAGRTQRVRLDRIEASPFQVRLVFGPAEIEQLADSILSTGLIHEPRARPHPSRPGWVELMPGEMRVRALQRLVERGEAGGVLEQDGEGGWLVPMRVEPADDEAALAMVFSENLDRSDLSAWEWAMAFRRRRDRLREAGQPSGVRDVAAVMRRPFQTVGEYLQVADGMAPEVMAGAGVLVGGEPQHERLARLSLAALLRVVRSGARGTSAGVETLLAELRKAGDDQAKEAETIRREALASGSAAATAGFQLNIRQPLETLSACQAATYLTRIIPAVKTLAERAGEAEPTMVESVRSALFEAAVGLEQDGRSG